MRQAVLLKKIEILEREIAAKNEIIKTLQSNIQAKEEEAKKRRKIIAED